MANNKTFYTLFDKLLEAMREQGELGPEERALLCRALGRSAVKICDEYTSIRNKAKQTYMKCKDDRLDRHKCAAAFMIAIMEKLQIKGNVLNRTFIKEHLAIMAGLTILGVFIKQGEDEAIKSLLKNNGGFKFPNIIHKTDQDYLYIWTVELYYLYKEKKLSILSLAHELFYLETYNKGLV